jgi:hypothetical protein
MQMPLADPVQIIPAQHSDPAALHVSPSRVQAAAAPRGPGKPACEALAAGVATAAAGAARWLDGMTRCSQPQEARVVANMRRAMSWRLRMV